MGCGDPTEYYRWRRQCRSIRVAAFGPPSLILYEEFTGDSGYFDTQVVYVAESGTQSRRLKRLAIMDKMATTTVI